MDVQPSRVSGQMSAKQMFDMYIFLYIYMYITPTLSICSPFYNPSRTLIATLL